MRLRSAWKEAKRSGHSRASADAKTSASGRASAAAKAPAGGRAAGASKTSGGARGAGGKAPTLPSRTRVLASVVVGLLVAAASLAALIARG